MIALYIITFIGGATFMLVLIALLTANRPDSIDEQIYANGIMDRDKELKVGIMDRDKELKVLNELLEKQDKTIYNQKLKINELLKVNNELRDEITTNISRSN